MIQLRTLGTLEIRGSAAEELRAVMAQPKRVALLVYLALAKPRGPHQRDKVLSLFWPELDAEHSRNALSQSVSFLRRQLGESVVVSRNGDGIAIDRERVWCDAIAFEEALDSRRWLDAMELYRGELLDAFHVANAPEFERWLEVERDRLRRRYLEVLESLGDAGDRAGNHGAAIVWWRRLAGADPYNSRVALRLMRSLASSGDPGGAIQHARLHEARLRDDLDARPHEEVLKLLAQLQSAAGTTRPESTAAPRSAPSASQPASNVEAPGRPEARPLVRRRTIVAAAALVLLVVLTSLVRPEQADIRSLAVLPFGNLAGDSTQLPLVDGMHDALITELARYSDISVISRTSVARFRNAGKSVPEIARELKVDGIVEGAVVRQGDRVSIRVQLVQGSTNRNVWARRYERDLRDMLVLQAELAEAITSEVRGATTVPERRGGRPPARVDSTERELYVREHYRRGLHFEIARSHAGLQAAKEAYRRAIARDSTFAPAYAALSTAYYLIADYDFAPMGPALDTARALAHQAVRLDSGSSEGWTALAIMLATDGRYDESERAFRRAIAMHPNDARAHYWYSNLLVALGRGDEALRVADFVEKIDPFAPRGVTAMQRYARWLISGTREELNVPVAQRPLPILKVEPAEPIAMVWEAQDLADQGNCAEARERLGRAQRLSPDTNMRMLAYLVPVYWMCGDRTRARALLSGMLSRRDAADHGNRIAMALVAVGDHEAALTWLRRNRWTLGQLTGLSADRRVDPLRSDARFTRILVDVGIRGRDARPSASGSNQKAYRAPT